MKKFWRNSFHTLKIISIIILIISCQKQEIPQNLPIEDKIPDEIADSIRVVTTTGETIDYILEAVHMYKYYDTKQTFVDTVFVTFYNPDESVKSTLKCNKAEVNDAKNTLTGIGNVVVKSENGILKAPYMILDRNTNHIYASQGVILIRGENILYGEEMETDLNLDRVEITKVSAEGKLDEDEINW